MQTYKFNIAAYHRQTREIGPADDLVYRRLMDLYYLREGPLLSDVKIVAQSVEYDADVVAGVLETFFKLTPEGWTHDAMQKEINAAKKATAPPKKRGRPRKVGPAP